MTSRVRSYAFQWLRHVRTRSDASLATRAKRTDSLFGEAWRDSASTPLLPPFAGEDIYAYVTLQAGVEPSDKLRSELVAHVRKEIGPIATPGVIHWAPGLPKTRSGKIMRRILRKIATNGRSTSEDELGDTSTLADPSVIAQLIDLYGK